jgi:hypothetical protein
VLCLAPMAARAGRGLPVAFDAGQRYDPAAAPGATKEGEGDAGQRRDPLEEDNVGAPDRILATVLPRENPLNQGRTNS